MSDPTEPPTTAQSLLGPEFREAADAGKGDPAAYLKGADPRYMEALRQQRAAKQKLTARRRPILRLVWDRDAQP